MSLLNLQASYFSIENPWRALERRFNRFRYRKVVFINQREAEVSWTNRAERELQRLDQPLVVELQLYFSCVVKKRVLFDSRVDESNVIPINNKLGLVFQPISSAVCDPHEFAASYPVGKDLSSGRAARMVPRRVEIDFRQGGWEGQFYY